MTQLFTSTWNQYVNLVTIDLTAWGDQRYGFLDSSTYEGAVPELSLVTWQGQDYLPIPFSVSGYQRGGENLAKPKVVLPDLSAAMYVTLARYGMAPGAPVTRYQALGDDILADDPQAPFMEELYLCNNVAFAAPKLTIELATHLDFQQAQFPRHIMYREEYPGLSIDLTR